MKVTRNDVRDGKVAPHVIENGVIVPPYALVNHLTLREHRERLRRINERPLSAGEEEELYPDEVERTEGTQDGGYREGGI